MTEQYADDAHRYRLDERIATGGMGVVWRATDTRLNRPVAVKVLKHELADDPQFRTRFDTEARNAAALQHPGIAGVYDYNSRPGGDDSDLSPFLVMELVDGQPLSALLAQARDRGRTMDPAVVRDLVTQTADALAVAHRAGIVHRDVKPANLLVTPDRRVKVTDFGIARAADDAQITRTGAVMGTPQYLSPEQARGNPSTPASDVYALGVVAFEALTGRRPFEAETPVATALAHLQQPVPDLPDDLPEDLRAVVHRALAKDPAERYADAAALAAALRGADTPPPVADLPPIPVADATAVLPQTGAPVARPTPPVAPTPRLDRAAPYEGDDRGKRRPVWPIVLVVLLLVAAAIAVIALVLSGDDDDNPSSGASTSRSQRSAPTTDATTESTGPETVDIDPDDYVGRNRFAVADDLHALDLGVQFVEEDNPGGETPDDVTSLNPTGEVTVGDTIEVHFWGAEPAPETTPPSDTPSDTPTETPTETTDTATASASDGPSSGTTKSAATQGADTTEGDNA